MTCTYLQTVDGDGRDARHEPDEGGSVLRVDTVQQRHGRRQVSSTVWVGLSVDRVNVTVCFVPSILYFSSHLSVAVRTLTIRIDCHSFFPHVRFSVRLSDFFKAKNPTNIKEREGINSHHCYGV